MEVKELMTNLKNRLDNLNIPFEYEYKLNNNYTDKKSKEIKTIEDIISKDSERILAILTVKYPNITIRNKKNEEKYLGDVYVVFKIIFVNYDYNINSPVFKITLFHVVRNEYNIEDILDTNYLNNIYTHSHITTSLDKGDEFTYYNDVFGTTFIGTHKTGLICLGTSLLSNKTNTVIINELEEIIFHYKKFLEYENIEGVAFQRICDLTIYNEHSKESFYFDELIKNYIETNDIEEELFNYDEINYMTTDIIYSILKKNKIPIILSKGLLKEIFIKNNITKIDIPNEYKNNEVNFRFKVSRDVLGSINIFKNKLEGFNEKIKKIDILFKGKPVNPIVKLNIDTNSDINTLISERIDNLINTLTTHYGDGEKMYTSLPVNNSIKLPLYAGILLFNLIKNEKTYV